MPHVIYKAHLTDVRTVVDMPHGAEILFCDTQEVTGPGISYRRRPTIWFRCDPANEMEQRAFHIVGTGHSFHESFIYRGTTIDGPYVWHVLEEPRS